MDPALVRSLAERRDDFLAFLVRRVGSRAVAEEILQDAFVRGVDRAETIRDGESAVAWFYRVLRNAVIDRRRRASAEARALERFAGELEATTRSEAEVHDAVCWCVRGLVETLKPEYAEAIRAVDLGDDSLGELASRDGITTNNAAVRLHRARTALGARVRESCGACAVHGCLDCSCRRRV